MSLLSPPAGAPAVPRIRRNSPRWVRLVLLLAATVVIANTVGIGRGLTALRDASDRFRALAAEVDRLREENGELREQARRLRDDSSAVEDLARRDLGLMRPGEKVIILADRPLEAPPPPDSGR